MMALDFFAGLGRFQDSMFLISLAIAAGDSSFAPGQIGIATGTYLTSSAITAAPKGRLLDRFGTRLPSQILLMGVALSYLLLLMGLKESSLSLLLASCLILGALRLNSGMMMQALWSALSRDSGEFAKASARETLITTVSQTVGPLLAAGLIGFSGGLLALASCGVLVTGSMIIWSTLAPRLDYLGESASPTNEPEPTGIPRRAFGLLLIGSLLALPLASLQLALASSESGSFAAILVATFTFGSALSMLALSLIKKTRFVGQVGLTAIAPVLLSLPFLLIFLGTPPPVVLAATLIVSGGSFSLASVSNRVSLRALVPRQSSNQVFGALVTGAAAASGVGAILFGQLYEVFGFRVATLSFSILLLAVAFLILLVRRFSQLENGISPMSG